ncbi:MAG: DUF1571 domain-containing protein [Fimbriiglobus sp.]
MTKILWCVAMLAFAGNLVGCDRWRQRMPFTAKPIPETFSRELANQEPVVAPQPPLPPPQPDEPLVPVPKSISIRVPEMPDSSIRDAVEIPTTPILQTGAISLPDDKSGPTYLPPTDDEKGPIRERLEEMKKRREERRDERTEKKDPAKPDVKTEPKAKADPANDAKKLIDASVKQYAEIKDFEAKLIKREVVNGKAMPQDEIVYHFRKAPLSVYMKVLSTEGQGREVMFVKGQFGDKMHVITGKGDNILVGAGYKTDVDPDSRTVTSKSRYRIYEAGFGRTLTGLTKALASTDGSLTVKALGQVNRKEFTYPLEAVQVKIAAGQDPLLPKGGTRQVFFDPKTDSPGYMLPVLVVTTDADGKEVEYYFFDQLKVPSSMKETDWNPANLGKKK